MCELKETLYHACTGNVRGNVKIYKNVAAGQDLRTYALLKGRTLFTWTHLKQPRTSDSAGRRTAPVILYRQTPPPRLQAPLEHHPAHQKTSSKSVRETLDRLSTKQTRLQVPLEHRPAHQKISSKSVRETLDRQDKKTRLQVP